MQGEIWKTWQIVSIFFEIAVIQKLLGAFHLNTVSSEGGIICLREREGGRVARGMQSSSKLYYYREGQAGIIQ